MTTSSPRDPSHAIGTITFRKYEPSPYDQPAEGPALVRIHVEEDFSGDIQGTGVVEFLQAQVSGDAASFVGIERVRGSIAGRTGTFVLQDQGTLTGNRVTGRWSVVSGSGTGELAGLRGDGGFTAELGQRADIALDYWFE
jgi:Protein of unknown function (DUF3224)